MFFNPQPKRKKVKASYRAKLRKLLAAVINRDKKCRRCLYTQTLTVHHIDHPHGDDTMENCITECMLCHYGEHHGGWLETEGDADNPVFVLTPAGKQAVKDGKLRPEIKDEDAY